MLTDLTLQTFYSTRIDNIPEDFYVQTLSKAIKYDRVSGYFSSNSLAYYAKGIEVLYANKGKMRFIISHNISEEDYNSIRKGYVNKRLLIKNLFSSFDYASSDLETKKKISNLAYLIEIGLVEIKIGFTHSGLFHTKYGIFRDAAENIVFFTGSLNETEAAFIKNYEEIIVAKSWESSIGELDSKVVEFENLWNGLNTDQFIFVKDIDEILKNELIRYSKGEIIINKNRLEDDALILYFDDTLKVENNLKNHLFDTSKRSLKGLVESGYVDEKFSRFSENLTYLNIEDIVKGINRYGKRAGIKVIIDDSVDSYIRSSKYQINKAAQNGLALKNQLPEFNEAFSEFKRIVNQEVDRPLYDLQCWLSFYHMQMKRSANFSVPGAGKTSMVYGTFAYLSSKEINRINKIVVIGPKNSFLSWKQEFRKVFGKKRELIELDVHAPGFSYEMMGKNINHYNLVLVNYESLEKYKDGLKNLINDRTLLVFDEVHKIKKVNSRRASIAIELAQKAPYRIVLTGTPIPNSYSDIWNFLHILYSLEYQEYFGLSEPILNNATPQDIITINEKLAPFFWRITKHQLEVPAENPDHIRKVMASVAEQKIIDMLWKKWAHMPFKLYIRLIQLSSNPSLLRKAISAESYCWYGEDIDESNIDEEFKDDMPDFSYSEEELINSLSQSSKYKQCINLSTELLSEDRKHIIWCIFVDTIKRLATDLEALGHRVAVLYGNVPLLERERIIEEFQQGGYDVLITNPHTLAESVSLHMVAHDAIYYEYSFNLTHMLQSRDRIHRLGLKAEQETNYFYLMTEGQEEKRSTIDYKIYARLMEKKQIMLDAIENQDLRCEFSIDEKAEILQFMEEMGARGRSVSSFVQ